VGAESYGASHLRKIAGLARPNRHPGFLLGFIKGWKVGMNSCQRMGKYSQGRLGRLGSFLGLAAFLPIFLLPLIYYGHLTNFSPLAVSRDLKTALPAIESRTEEPAPFHESKACPICQAASSFQDFGSFLSFDAPDGSTLLGPLSERYSSAGLAPADGLTLQSRAPPVMPLPQTTA
jgi:hypothetical protein